MEPDQTRALIRRPDRYEPENRSHEEFAKHHSCASPAAWPPHPRDKPQAEGPVLLVQRWILALLSEQSADTYLARADVYLTGLSVSITCVFPFTTLTKKLSRSRSPLSS